MELGITTFTGSFGSIKGGIYYNVSSHVGKNKPNQPDDVQLVQFLCKRMAIAGEPKEAPDVVAKMAAVEVTGTYDDATGAAILALQKWHGSIADGIVSPAKGGSYAGGVHTIWLLNSFVKGSIPKVWPRLQDLPGCPGLVQTLIPVIV